MAALLLCGGAASLSSCQTAGKLVITPPPPLPEIAIPLWKIEKIGDSSKATVLPTLFDVPLWDEKNELLPVGSQK